MSFEDEFGPPVAESEDLLFGPWFAAGYESLCSGCWDQVEVGNRIRADGRGGWLCEDCGEG